MRPTMHALFPTMLMSILIFLTATAVGAQDAEIGVRSLRAPSMDGQRSLSAILPAATGGAYFQEGLDRPVPAGRSRIVLDYSTEAENWSVRRTLVPDLQAVAGGSVRAMAVLPQDQVVRSSVPGVSLERHQDPRFHRNPLKLEHGTRVLYRWRMEIPGGERRGTEHAFVMPHPLVFAVLGDSYGSGEGAPERQGTFLGQVEWSDRDDHRSRYNGHRQAVVRFRRDHPELWVEFLHTGISGATLSTTGSSGYLTDYQGERDLKMIPIPVGTVGLVPILVWLPIPQRWGVTAEAQFTRVERWIAESGFERTHAVILSGGGNDAGFSDVILTAILGSLRFDYGNTRRRFQANLEALTVAAETELRPALDAMIRPEHLLWTTYPNLTRDQDGDHSGIPVEPSANVGLMLFDAAVGGDDLINAEELLTEDLNPTVRTICREIMERCTIVEVEDAALGHGINADPENRWFNTFQDAQDEVQAALDGAAHPNREGQGLYVDPVLSALNDLYHPLRGSEYRRMAADAQTARRDAARDRARARVRERVEARRREATKRTGESARAVLTGVEAPVRLSVAAEGRLNNLATARKSRAESADPRLRLRDHFDSILSRPSLRLVLPAPGQRSAIRARLTRGGSRDALPAFDEALKQLGSLDRLDGAALRRALEEERAKAAASEGRDPGGAD